MANREDEIREMAKDYAAIEKEHNELSNKVTQLINEKNSVEAKLEKARKKLTETVGANTSERHIKISEGEIVQVKFCSPTAQTVRLINLE